MLDFQIVFPRPYGVARGRIVRGHVQLSVTRRTKQIAEAISRPGRAVAEAKRPHALPKRHLDAERSSRCVKSACSDRLRLISDLGFHNESPEVRADFAVRRSESK